MEATKLDSPNPITLEHNKTRRAYKARMSQGSQVTTMCLDKR